MTLRLFGARRLWPVLLIAVVAGALSACLATPPPPVTTPPTATALPAPTTSPAFAPSATPAPPTASPTARPPTLAVPAEFAAGNAARLASLQRAQPGLRIDQVKDSAAALALVQAGQAHWAIASGLPPSGNAGDTCLTPYAPIVHFSSLLDGMDLARLRAIYEDTDKDWAGPVYYSGDAALMRRILSVSALAVKATALPTWQDVIARVASDRTAIAYAPWSEVDARVKTLRLDGKRASVVWQPGYSYGDAWRIVGNAPRPADLAQTLCPVHTPVQFMATGDILMGWYVQEAYLKTQGPLYPFRKVRDLLRMADITFADFENPLVADRPIDGTVFAFGAEPIAVKGLLDAGIDVVGLANNHMGDFGQQAISDTLSIMRRNGIGSIGAGRNRAEAHSAWITTTKGITIAMLGYNEIPPDAYMAGESSPGTAWIEPDVMAAEIKQAKLKADIVIVALHMGTEYTVHPTLHQQEVARRAAESGADLIIGDHPHVVQALGFFGKTFVTYSLGDFVYVQPGSPATGEALVLSAIFEGRTLKQITLLPVYIDRAQPASISETEAKLMMARIFDASRLIASLPAGAEQPTAAPAPVVLPSPAAAVHGKIAAVALDGQGADVVLWSATTPVVAGSTITRLTSDGMLNDAPVWSPDGRYIAYSSARSGNVDIYVAAADGSNPVNLTNNAAWDDYPAWSPDGKQIAFTTNRDGPFKLYAMNVDGTNVRRLTDGPAWDTTPAWSPDGKRIAFASDRMGRFQIFTTSRDGADVRQVTSHPHSSIFPAWSPDSRMLAFQSYRDESVLHDDDANQDRDYELFSCDAGGSNMRQLTDNLFADIQPAWSPNGRQIAFVSNRNGSLQIYVMDVATGDATQATQMPGEHLAPRWTP